MFEVCFIYYTTFYRNNKGYGMGLSLRSYFPDLDIFVSFNDALLAFCITRFRGMDKSAILFGRRILLNIEPKEDICLLAQQ